MFALNSNVLLTGGTGFFGLALLRYWRGLGDKAPRVTILSRNPQRFTARYPDLANFVTWRTGDVQDPTAFDNLGAFTHLLHGATDSTLGASLESLTRFDQILGGTRNALDFATKAGVRRFLLTSSGGVYGRQPSDLEKIPEHYLAMPDPLDTKNAYSVAKRASEHLCALYAERHQIETVVARCFAFVGPDLPFNTHFAIGNFIRDALFEDEITVSGDGTDVRTYLDQRDLAIWLTTLLDQGVAGEAYNVGSDQEITISGLAHLVRDRVAPGKRVQILGNSKASSNRARYVPSIQKAREGLRLDVKVPLSDAIDFAANAHRRK